MGKAPSDPEFDAATDNELVARTLAGEGEAFGTLWDRHSPRVYGYAYRRLGDREQAEDVTAETFRRAGQARHLPGRRVSLLALRDCPQRHHRRGASTAPLRRARYRV